MPRPPKARAPLKDAALRLFVERGIDGTGIRDLAKAAGCSEAAVYRHWSSKEQLVRSLYQEHLQAVSELIEQAIASTPSLEGQIRSAITALYDLFDRQPLVFRFVLLAKQDPALAVGLTIRTPIDVVQGFAERAIAEQQASGEPATLAAAVTGTVLETASFVLVGRLSGPLSRHTDQVTRLALRILRK